MIGSGPVPTGEPGPAVGHAWVQGPAGPVEYLLTGDGAPVTVFVPGLIGSVAETRPFGSGVAGSRAFVQLRGHGAIGVRQAGPAGPAPGDYAELAAEVAAVTEATGATRGLGVSLGAGALIRLLVDRPGALERVVLVLPPTLDGRGVAGNPARTTARLQAMAEAVDAGDVETLARLLREHQPAVVRSRPAVTVWARRRASQLVGTPVAAMLRGLAGQLPVADAAELTAVTCPVLVLGQEGDDVHPVHVARRYAEVLPRATLEVLPAGGVPWTRRDRLRELVSGFLNG